jgi:hypothetical protein
MIEQYRFQGSCCSLESVPQTLGCRLTVADTGNCFWYPYCGVPDPLDEEISAGIEFTTDATDECPESEFDPLFLNTSHPDYIPPEDRNNDNVTCVPTMAPSLPEGSTMEPIGGGSSGGAAPAAIRISFMLMVAVVASAMSVMLC